MASTATATSLLPKSDPEPDNDGSSESEYESDSSEYESDSSTEARPSFDLDDPTTYERVIISRETRPELYARLDKIHLEDEYVKKHIGDPLSPMRLFDRSDGFVNVEWISLKLHRPAQIYGEVKVDIEWDSRCVYVFRRHWNQAETVHGGDGESRLTLCGPNHCLYNQDTQEFEVNLFEKGGKSLLRGCAPLGSEIIDWRKVHRPFYAHLRNKSASLTICYTRFAYSVPTLFRFRILNIDDHRSEADRGDFEVKGTITAEQTLPETNLIRHFTLFNSESPVVVPFGEPIPLPREVFVLPINDEEKGTGGSFKITMNLSLVHLRDQRSCVVSGDATVVLDARDVLGTPKFIKVANTGPKRKIDELEGICVRITSWTFHEYMVEGEEEVLNHEP